jgi:RluA family pseudouridine synthase
MTIRWRVSCSSRLIDAIRHHVGPTFSVRLVKQALDANFCYINGRIERFASKRVRSGDWIEMKPGWERFKTVGQPVGILYENDELIVINKPPRFVCTDESVQKRLRRKAWLAHRLDKDTTGVLLLGKTVAVAKELQAAFKRRDVDKEYLALVDGAVAKSSGAIESKLVKKSSFQGQTVWGSGCDGVWARTEWRLLQAQEEASLVLCRPETGRTHQLRVHLAEMGHPILVDRQYACQFRSHLLAFRPLLHASQLFLNWDGKSFAWSAPLPADFQQAMEFSHLGVNISLSRNLCTK